jgi:hypothetical protein
VKIKIIKKDVDIVPKNLNLIAQFAKYTAQKLRIKKDIVLYLLKKDHDVEGISTAGYNPENNDVYVRCGGRALVDSLRSIAHEFGHARQKELGGISEDKEIPNIGGVIEDEANAAAGRLIKMFVRDTDQKWIYKD